MSASASGQPHERITAAIRRTTDAGGTALVPYITAGYPQKDRFITTLRAIASATDVVEVGVPFSDPMADGVTIQRASHAAIAAGVSLRWILAELAAAAPFDAPIVLMSYLNPLLNFGFKRLAEASVPAGVCGFIVPDLPIEESAELAVALDAQGLALIQLVTPATPPERLRMLCTASRGFVYAVTVTGITGGARELPAEVTGYLDRVRALTTLPVCAGFGVRRAEQVRKLAPHTDGVVVGSALVEQLEAGVDPVGFLRGLRAVQ
ncbi:MAG: tryptophan synthase subunit alpha [Chromatiales bacterium]|jgi:tryptophan synthase alpha chain|nr:MAG: tryptophan synthase subunit alpha [Chromatiales bacterium]